ncbi:MAG: ATP-binding protein [Betaproteobacteria bacterium]|jgi:anti-sigma regulatory factor (Ser/Thr protein kinase)
MPRIDPASVTRWITTAALAHGDALPNHLVQRLQISRRQAHSLLKRLVALQWLQASGTPRAPRHAPGPLRQVVKRYPLAGLQEDTPWRCDFAPCFALPAAVKAMAQHAFTELLNNAIDHSGGESVTVSMRQTPLQLQLLVSDDGVGLFRRVAEHFELAEPAVAMMELAKGKLTSDPERHCGHGLFFTSQLADVFDLHANAASFQRRGWDAGRWHAQRPVTRAGTSIYWAVALDTPRTLEQVLCAHSMSGTGYGFERTRVPLALLAPPGMRQLSSRAEARRVAQRLERFACAELDFTGFEQIGHGFADELFRVIGRRHPGLELQPVEAAPPVAAMIAAVRAAA